MTFLNAFSKSFGSSDASTACAVSTNRSWRWASVSLGFARALRGIMEAFQLDEPSIKPQKITMLIEVIPGPGLNVVGKVGEKAADICGPVDDFIMLKSVNYAGLDTEVHGSCLAFNILPEDILLLSGEDIQSLLHGTQPKVVFACLRNPPNHLRGNDCPQKDQGETKIKLTFLPVFQKTEARNDGGGRQKNKSQRSGQPDEIPKWHFHHA
nr:hypothetical protein [Phenylobacterium sp.]